MRVGTAIFLLFLALFGFGYFLAHSVNLSQELDETRQQLARLQQESRALEAQYRILLEERNRLTGQVTGLTGENENLRRRIDTLETERVALSRQIESLEGQVVLAQRANGLFGWLVSDHGPLALLIVPALPLSLGAAYVMAHRKAANPSSRLPTNPATFRALLTREEMYLLRQHRRSQTRARHLLHSTLPG